MPETPDFESIAIEITAKLADTMDPDHAKDWIADLVRLVWNARGAADVAQLEEEFLGPVNEVWMRGGYTLDLKGALGSLDR